MGSSSIKTNYQWKYVFLSMFMAFMVCGSFIFYKYHKNNNIDVKSVGNNQAKITSTTSSQLNEFEGPIWDFDNDEYIPGFSREHTNRKTTKMKTKANKTKNHSKTNSSSSSPQTKQTTGSTTSTTKQSTVTETTTKKVEEPTTGSTTSTDPKETTAPPPSSTEDGETEE